MRVTKSKIAMLAAVAATGSLALSPSLAAVLGAISPKHVASPVSLDMLGSIGSFTPVTSDDRLAKAYAKAARESQSRGFRFTPTSGSINGRSLTILVRAPGLPAANGANERVLPNLGVAPVGYRLGVTKGLAQFSTGARAEAMQPDPPIEGKIVEPVPSYTLHPKKDRFSANLQLQREEATAASPTEASPQTLGAEQRYGVDLSSSYSLTRNLNVQAGVRYKGPGNRLAPALTDQTRDSQAVYVGTTFKF
ncbi:hypothetical protein [Sphingobium nicotianae]|uniref:Porin n=1 Tax=Sphingobium nicotianae TaxID=2782607 RepID=A0A9X1IPZ2_9SPHN|nr:hypothetical protein [Sphingobium nicotianae]MBT2186372.1 hypothetical protein [Sphingobium nicotianae]